MVVGPDRRPVAAVDEFLGWLTNIERSPNTVEAYARDLKAFWSFLAARGLEWERVTVAELGEFAAWARQPADNVVVLSELAARRSARTVNRMLTAVMAFYEFHGRRGSSLARELVAQTRLGRGAYKPLLLKRALDPEGVADDRVDRLSASRVDGECCGVHVFAPIPRPPRRRGEGTRVPCLGKDRRGDRGTPGRAARDGALHRRAGGRTITAVLSTRCPRAHSCPSRTR